MDTSNRQDGAVAEESDRVEVTVSERVAIATNLKKIGCDELTPKEWVEIIDVALAHAKPLKYLPFFLPIDERNLSCFHLVRTGESLRSSWFNRTFYTGASGLGILRGAKVIEICEVSHLLERKLSIKIIMDTRGMFFYASCVREDKNFCGTPTIYEVHTICGKEPLEDAIIHYPQIGPRVLIAITEMYKYSLQEKMKVVDRLKIVTDKLNAICANVDMGWGHYCEKFPWGVIDSSSKMVGKMSI